MIGGVMGGDIVEVDPAVRARSPETVPAAAQAYPAIADIQSA